MRQVAYSTCWYKHLAVYMFCSEGTLHKAIAQHSSVKDIRLVLDKFTGAPRGFAFVHFHTVADASRVLHALQVNCEIWVNLLLSTERLTNSRTWCLVLSLNMLRIYMLFLQLRFQRC